MATAFTAAILLTDERSAPATEPVAHNTEEGVAMYQKTMFGQSWVSKDDDRWHDWKGRQIYKYRYAGQKKRA